jgi:hypothetical protein
VHHKAAVSKVEISVMYLGAETHKTSLQIYLEVAVAADRAKAKIFKLKQQSHFVNLFSVQLWIFV